MSFFFYLLSSFPAFGINFGVGNIPSRYLTFIFLVFFKINKNDLILLMVPFVAYLYPLMTISIRNFHYLDLSYVLGSLYLIMGIRIIRKNASKFKKFVLYFWLLNIIYAIFQNCIIIIQNGDSKFALLHQNMHSPDYIIPQISYLPYLYRVSGLFIESAPFVIYLIFTHFAFVVMKFSWKIKFFNLLFIFLCGAKIGLLFLFLYLIFKLPIIKRTNFFYIILLLAMILPLLISFLNIFFTNFNAHIYSIILRFQWLISTYDFFIDTWYTVLFGSGYISSMELLEGVDNGYQKGLDFFSTFIVANGIIGSILFLTPLVIWINKYLQFGRELNNIFLIGLFLSLLTMGSLLNYQYSYLLFILAYSSEVKSINRFHIKLKE